MGERTEPGDGALRRYWPHVGGYAMAAIIGLAPLARLARLAHAPFAPSPGQAIAGLVGALMLLALAELALERLRLIDKSPKATATDDEDGLPPLRPQLPPIREAGAFDLAAEPPSPSGEPTLTPLGGGALPASFARDGRRIVWRVEKLPTA